MESQNREPGTAQFLVELYGLQGQTAVVTGGTGVLGSVMARGLARAGARVAILGRRKERAEAEAQAISEAGGEAMAAPADVLDRRSLADACASIQERWGDIDILVNAAGGNTPAATVSQGMSFFDVSEAGLREVVDLNLLGSLLPTQVFGAAMARKPTAGRRGCIVMMSSMAAQRAMTRVAGYGVAKAAIDNLTRWLATDLARSYGDGIRVNAIAPGFFVGEQNRALLLNGDGTPTARGETVIAHTPAGRFGDASDLVSTLLWLCGPGARFVTGVVVPVDGGFSAFSGV